MDEGPLTSVIILEIPECWLTFLVYGAPFNVKQEDIKWHIFNIAPSLSFELCKKFLWSLCLNTMSGIEIKTLLPTNMQPSPYPMVMQSLIVWPSISDILPSGL